MKVTTCFLHWNPLSRIIERADESVRLRDTLQDSENIRHAEKQILLQEVQTNKHLRDTLDECPQATVLGWNSSL